MRDTNRQTDNNTIENNTTNISVRPERQRDTPEPLKDREENVSSKKKTIIKMKVRIVTRKKIGG